MSRIWKVTVLIILSTMLLAACGASIEQQAEKGLGVAETTFYGKKVLSNEEVDGTTLYKPNNFLISDVSDAQNIILNKGKQPFILFINPNESSESQLFYNILHADQTTNLIDERKFQEDGTFGFAAVIQNEDEKIELIANVGGAKITTLTERKNVVNDLEVMMQIVRSID